MRRLLTVLALATVVTSPALAGTSHRHVSGRALYQDPYFANAYQDPNGIVTENRSYGWDPDPNVRLEMRRDALSGHE
jgi:hypothetical protein